LILKDSRWQVLLCAFLSLLAVSYASQALIGKAFLASDQAGMGSHFFSALYAIGPAYGALLLLWRIQPRLTAGGQSLVFGLNWSLLLAIGLFCFTRSATSRSFAPALPPRGDTLITLAEVVTAPLLCSLILIVGRASIPDWLGNHEVLKRRLTVVADAVGGAILFLWLVLMPGKLLS